ncbi:MAG: hypothetical protein C0418_05785, partial [Coriobacteriaceae bacterium]|nr:hypothetical protein [Coriobacteriaceae bacterium]
MALVVVTGGARSGKSSLAERLAAQRGEPVTVVVFGEGDGDPEMADRIDRHRRGRPDGWRTLEPAAAGAWLGDVPDGDLLVLDCLGTLVGRVMAEEWSGDVGFRDADMLPPRYAETVERRVDEVLAALAARVGDTLVVTNEVGGGVVPAHALGRLFRDVLGRANRTLVDRAEAA